MDDEVLHREKQKDLFAMEANETTYRVGKNEAGEIVGIVENLAGKGVFTELQVQQKIFIWQKLRKEARLAGNWYRIQSDTKLIEESRTLAQMIQKEKKSLGIPLDFPEVC